MGRARAARGFLLLPAGPHPCPSPQSLLWGRGTLSGSGAVRPGFGAPLRAGLFLGCVLVSSIRFGGWGPGRGVARLRGVSGGLVVNCIVDASIKNVFLLLFWFAAPLGPSFVLPVRSFVGGGGGRGACVRRAAQGRLGRLCRAGACVRREIRCCVLCAVR